MRDFHQNGRSAVYATEGMCATSHPLAAGVAIDVLKQGGNAVDAAIAAGVLLGLCEPQMTGIGGDMFALIQEKPGADVVALNASGRAPASLDAAELRDAGMANVPTYGVQAVTIPGAIDGFCALSDKYGKMDMAQTLAPAIHYATAGVPVAPRVALDWALAEDKVQGSAKNLYLNNGKALTEGQVFRSPGQARVLQAIATKGRAGFYEGEVAQDFVDSLNALGGRHTLDDFANNAPTWDTPISSDYRGIKVLEHPPNGHGATANLMLNMMKEFDWASMNALGAERVHIEAEVAKLAYDTRNRIVGDMDYTTRLAHMLDPATAKSLAALVDPKRAIKSATVITESIHNDTIYITVVDKNRMSVSLIYSIFHSFGSGLASEKFGVLFQNRGAGFTLEAGHPNELKGGKRPMHTIIPGMIARADGCIKMPFGVMGGGYQPNGHARFVSNMVDYGMDAQAAIDAPRSFADGDMLKLEKGYGDDVRADLSERGHKITTPPEPIGGAQAILIREDGVLKGASDPRKDGCALGY
ncbi:MAG: gamma-glutamyltransferase [Planktomarina sp.]